MTTKTPKTERESANPLYSQVVEGIKARIESGAYKINSRIPTEPELCEEYGVSRITVRRAVEELEAEGLLIRRQGKGTFVTEKAAKVAEKAVYSFNEACRAMGKEASTRVIGARTEKATAEDMAGLNLPENSRVVEIDRVRYADGEAVLLERNHFPMALSYLLESNLKGSIYELLRTYGVKPSWASKKISLIEADENKASLLGIKEGTSLILVQEVVYDQKDRPLHVSHLYVRGERFTLKF